MNVLRGERGWGPAMWRRDRPDVLLLPSSRANSAQRRCREGASGMMAALGGGLEGTRSDD